MREWWAHVGRVESREELALLLPEWHDHAQELQQQRDAWVRAFNRLDAAVSHHKRASDRFATDADEALYAARDWIVKSLGPSDA